MRTIRAGLAAFVLAGACLLALPPNAAAQKKQHDVLTAAEIDSSAQRDGDLWQALHSLRPKFLETPQAQVSFGASPVMRPVVYLDGMRESSVDDLHSIRASDVLEVRYLDPSRASTEYGPSAGGGAVIVQTRRSSPPTKPDTSGTSRAARG